MGENSEEVKVEDILSMLSNDDPANANAGSKAESQAEVNEANGPSTSNVDPSAECQANINKNDHDQSIKSIVPGEHDEIDSPSIVGKAQLQAEVPAGSPVHSENASTVNDSPAALQTETSANEPAESQAGSVENSTVKLIGPINFVREQPIVLSETLPDPIVIDSSQDESG